MFVWPCYNFRHIFGHICMFKNWLKICMYLHGWESECSNANNHSLSVYTRFFVCFIAFRASLMLNLRNGNIFPHFLCTWMLLNFSISIRFCFIIFINTIIFNYWSIFYKLFGSLLRLYIPLFIPNYSYCHY